MNTNIANMARPIKLIGASWRCCGVGRLESARPACQQENEIRVLVRTIVILRLVDMMKVAVMVIHIVMLMLMRGN